MAQDALDTIEAILAGLHALAADAESVSDEGLRQRLNGTILGLRSAALAARGQVAQLQQDRDDLAAEILNGGEQGAGYQASRGPRMKWGCYQFDDVEGLFCTVCYDTRNRRVRTMRHNSGALVCPNCRTLFPVR